MCANFLNSTYSRLNFQASRKPFRRLTLEKKSSEKKNLVSRKLSVNKEKRRKPFHSWLSSVKNIVYPVEQWG